MPVPAHATTFAIHLPLPTEVQSKNPDKSDASSDLAPFLTATLSTGNGSVDGQLLKQYEKHIDHCWTCTADTSLGGLGFSNYEGADLPPFKNGQPFNLYVNKPTDAPQFFICYFDSITGRALPCEVSETIDAGKLFLTYRFPQEYTAEAFAIDSDLKAVIRSFQASQNSADSITPPLLARPAGCWHPQPGSSGAQLVHLWVGPQQLNIPIAYGSFGKFSPAQQILEIYLTLPGLQPLSATDLSPVLARGFSRYINIYISYNDKALYMVPSLSTTDGLMSLFSDESPIADNKILPYKTFKKYPNRYDIGVDELYYSADPRKTFSTFPPSNFDCSSFAPGANADCEFQVVLGLTSKIADKPDAGLDVDYSFSKDYFSQIPGVNRCLQEFIQSILPVH